MPPRTGYDNLGDRLGLGIPQHQTPDGNAPEATKGTDNADWQAPIASGEAPGFTAAFFPALSNTPEQIKGAQGKLGGWNVENQGNSTLYLQFFAIALGSVTLGTTTPYFVLAVPAGGVLDDPPSMPGVDFWAGSVAICVAATGSPTGLDAPDADAIATFFYV